MKKLAKIYLDLKLIVLTIQNQSQNGSGLTMTKSS